MKVLRTNVRLQRKRKYCISNIKRLIMLQKGKNLKIESKDYGLLFSFVTKVFHQIIYRKSSILLHFLYLVCTQNVLIFWWDIRYFYHSLSRTNFDFPWKFEYSHVTCDGLVGIALLVLLFVAFQRRLHAIGFFRRGIESYLLNLLLRTMVLSIA